MTGTAAMPALASGNTIDFLAALDAVDGREIIDLPDGRRAIVVLVGVTVLRTVDPTNLDGHTHDSVDQARECYLSNVAQATELAETGQIDPYAALLAMLKVVEAGAPAPTGMIM